MLSAIIPGETCWLQGRHTGLTCVSAGLNYTLRKLVRIVGIVGMGISLKTTRKRGGTQ